MKGSLKIATIVTFALAASASQTKSAYTPDNNGRVMWGQERQVAPIMRAHKHKKRIAHRYKRHGKKRTANKSKTPPWNMVKVKTVQGLYLTVHPAYAHKFLKFFELLSENKVEVPKDMVGCYARGRHVRGSNHYIGAACDIQTGWNKTIPEMYHAGKWIKQAGLYDGCSFGDCGHIEAIRGTHNRAPNLYASMEKFKSLQSTANYQP